MDHALRTVSEFWGSDEILAQRSKGLHWTDHPQIQAYICEQTSGESDIHWDHHFWRNYILPQSRPLNVLSLGCGTADIEISLIKRGCIGQMTACDVSEGALIRARQTAATAGVDINFLRVDLNCLALPPDAYDVIMWSSSLHHVANLEPVIFQLRYSLRAQGLLVINEYVGPSRFQFSPAQVAMIDRLFGLLPEKYRWRISNPSILKESVDYPTVQFLLGHDPSEAVRSAEIVPLLRRFFKVYEERPFGGSLLHFLLHDIAGNFSISDPVDRAIMGLLINTERSLIESGALDSDFVYMVMGC